MIFFFFDVLTCECECVYTCSCVCVCAYVMVIAVLIKLAAAAHSGIRVTNYRLYSVYRRSRIAATFSFTSCAWIFRQRISVRSVFIKNRKGKNKKKTERNGFEQDRTNFKSFEIKISNFLTITMAWEALRGLADPCRTNPSPTGRVFLCGEFKILRLGSL